MNKTMTTWSECWWRGLHLVFAELLEDAAGLATFFFLAAMATITLECTLYVGGLVFWDDVLHTNPHRSHLGSLITVFAIGGMGGVWFTVDMLAALLVASISMYFVIRHFGRVSVAVLLVLVPVCVLLVYAQDNALPNFKWYTDTPESDAMQYGPLGRLCMFSASLIPALTASWWIVNGLVERVKVRTEV
jgi:hypothetical protein